MNKKSIPAQIPLGNYNLLTCLVYTDPITAKIGTRTFTFRAEAVAHKTAAADMVARGWEPTYYLGTGVRGAKFLAYRSLRTGEFQRVCKL